MNSTKGDESLCANSRSTSVLIAVALVVAGVLAYANTFRVPFLLDDASAIRNNRSITLPLRWRSVLTAADAGTASGRPLLNTSFALNRAIGGDSVIGYHVFNLSVHVFSALALYGLVRRTLLLKGVRDRFYGGAEEIAGITALLWMLHPLLTEAVTYISERAESMAGLFYLVTLYAYIRAVPNEPLSRTDTWVAHRSRAWLLVSQISCLCGMATKEVMVTAPVVVLLYDRTFISGSFLTALKGRKGYYCGLASSWMLLGVLLFSNPLADRSVGYGFGVNATSYLLTEAKAVATYTRLVAWPSPLIFDHGREFSAGDAWSALPYLVFVVGLLSVTVFMWRRKSQVAFLLVGFFVILSPTSSIVPIAAQPMAESRMYLPAAALIVLAVLGTVRLFGRPGIALLYLTAALFGGLTVARNEAYASAILIWKDTVAKVPSNSRAHDNYGVELSKMPAMQSEAVRQYEEAIVIRPSFAEAHRDLAVALSEIPGRSAEAIGQFEKALQLRPNFPEAENGLGVELGKLPGRSGDSMDHLRAALRLNPDYPQAHSNLAAALAKLPGQMDAAIAEYGEALRLDPNFPEAHNGLAVALTREPGRTDEALDQFSQAIRIRPGYINALCNRAKVLAAIPGRGVEAIGGFKEVLGIDPGNVDANFGLGKLLGESGMAGDTGTDYLAKACQLDPRRVDIQIALANSLLGSPGMLAQAEAHYEAALALDPNLPEGHNGLGVAYAKEGNVAKAIEELQAAVQLRPGFKEAEDNLRALEQRKIR